jgi:hypothetical protein
MTNDSNKVMIKLIAFIIFQNSFENPLISELVDSRKESLSETLTYMMEFKPDNTGSYAICLDNRKSRFGSKYAEVLFIADFNPNCTFVVRINMLYSSIFWTL